MTGDMEGGEVWFFLEGGGFPGGAVNAEIKPASEMRTCIIKIQLKPHIIIMHESYFIAMCALDECNSKFNGLSRTLWNDSVI